MVLTWKIKAIIAGLILVGIGYSYFWTYSQGKTVGQAECVSKSVKALKDALERQEQEFRLQRQEEMREASTISKQMERNRRQVVIQEKEVEKIIYVKDDIRNCTASVDLIRVLNASRGDPTPAEDGTVPGGRDAEVSASS